MERPAHAKPHLQIIHQNKALEHILRQSQGKSSTEARDLKSLDQLERSEMLYEPLSTYHLEHEKIILELRNSVILNVRIIVLTYLKLFRVTKLSQNCIGRMKTNCQYSLMQFSILSRMVVILALQRHLVARKKIFSIFLQDDVTSRRGRSFFIFFRSNESPKKVL